MVRFMNRNEIIMYRMNGLLGNELYCSFVFNKNNNR